MALDDKSDLDKQTRKRKSRTKLLALKEKILGRDIELTYIPKEDKWFRRSIVICILFMIFSIYAGVYIGVFVSLFVIALSVDSYLAACRARWCEQCRIVMEYTPKIISYGEMGIYTCPNCKQCKKSGLYRHWLYR